MCSLPHLVAGKCSYNINLDVIILESADGTRVAARPSGTEPKIKFYFSVRLKSFSIEKFDKTQRELLDKIGRIASSFGIKA